MTGTRFVAIFRAPNRLTVRFAASIPIASGVSSLMNFRWTSYQASRCMAPDAGSTATGETANE
jgi:hypothetical protein